VHPETKGFENPLQIQPNPLQKDSKTIQQIKGHNPQMELCPKTMKKMGKFWGFGILGKK
jgi:hypothetical protein